MDFAPRTEQEIDFLRYMKKQDEFVSVELILSGRGFQTIHSFLDPSVIIPRLKDRKRTPRLKLRAWRSKGNARFAFRRWTSG